MGQKKASFIELRTKEILVKMAHELVSIGGSHTGAFDLEVMTRVEGDDVVGEDKSCELDKKLSRK